MGERSLLIAAERLFEAMGFPPGEAHVHRYVSPYEKGWKLQRKWIEDDRPRVEDMTGVHPDRNSLWRSIADQREMFNKIATGIAADLGHVARTARNSRSQLRSLKPRDQRARPTGPQIPRNRWRLSPPSFDTRSDPDIGSSN